MEDCTDVHEFVALPSDADSKHSEGFIVTTSTGRVKCPECKRYSAEDAAQLTRHIRKVHRGEHPFQCAMCDYTTTNKVLFEEHVRIHQGIKPYKCSFCAHTSVSKKNLKKHELIHRPDNPLKCPNCPYIAKHRRGLACHNKKCSGTGLKCKLCDKTFKDKETLNSHCKVLKRCDECSYKVCTKNLLTVHKIMEHENTEPARKHRKHKKPDIFKCVVCKWSSNSKPRILLHLIHHPNQKVNEDLIDITVLRNHGIMT